MKRIMILALVWWIVLPSHWAEAQAGKNGSVREDQRVVQTVQVGDTCSIFGYGIGSTQMIFVPRLQDCMTKFIEIINSKGYQSYRLDIEGLADDTLKQKQDPNSVNVKIARDRACEARGVVVDRHPDKFSQEKVSCTGRPITPKIAVAYTPKIGNQYRGIELKLYVALSEYNAKNNVPVTDVASAVEDRLKRAQIASEEDVERLQDQQEDLAAKNKELSDKVTDLEDKLGKVSTSSQENYFFLGDIVDFTLSAGYMGPWGSSLSHEGALGRFSLAFHMFEWLELRACGIVGAEFDVGLIIGGCGHFEIPFGRAFGLAPHTLVFIPGGAYYMAIGPERHTGDVQGYQVFYPVGLKYQIKERFSIEVLTGYGVFVQRSDPKNSNQPNPGDDLDTGFPIMFFLGWRFGYEGSHYSVSNTSAIEDTKE